MEKPLEGNIKRVFDGYQPQVRDALLTVRSWIYELVVTSSDVGQLEECLKWGCPSYLTHSPQSGTTLRLSQCKSNPHEYALSVHCQTNLIDEFKVVYPRLKYDKSRSVIFDSAQPIDKNIIKQFIYLALTYHVRKKRY